MKDPVYQAAASLLVHHCARCIDRYVNEGVRKDFIYPKWMGWLDSLSVFSQLISRTETPLANSRKLELIEAMLMRWPQHKLDQFYPFPVLRMFQRLSPIEQDQLWWLLGSVYDFDLK